MKIKSLVLEEFGIEIVFFEDLFPLFEKEMLKYLLKIVSSADFPMDSCENSKRGETSIGRGVFKDLIYYNRQNALRVTYHTLLKICETIFGLVNVQNKVIIIDTSKLDDDLTLFKYIDKSIAIDCILKFFQNSSVFLPLIAYENNSCIDFHKESGERTEILLNLTRKLGQKKLRTFSFENLKKFSEKNGLVGFSRKLSNYKV